MLMVLLLFLALAPAGVLSQSKQPVPVLPAQPVLPRTGTVPARALFGLVQRDECSSSQALCTFGLGCCEAPLDCCGTGCVDIGNQCCAIGEVTANDHVCPETMTCCGNGCIPGGADCCDDGTYCEDDECSCYAGSGSKGLGQPVRSPSVTYDGSRAGATAASGSGGCTGEQKVLLGGAAYKGGGHGGGGSSGSSGSSGDSGDSTGSTGSGTSGSSSSVGGSCSSGSISTADMGLLQVLVAALAFM